MAITDKDKFQKQRAIRFCVANDLLPYLEVKVLNDKDISDDKSTLTDIDVMGIEISNRSDTRRIIFDCKTLKTSPINRAFWAAGLAKYTSSSEAFLILERRPLDSHRLSAIKINVRIFDTNLFDKYAESQSIDYLDKTPYSVDIEAWYHYLLIFEKNKKIEDLGEYINSFIPLAKDHSKILRGILAIARKYKGELDPEKSDHMAVYSAIVMSLCLTLSSIASELSEVFDPESTRTKFEDVVKYYIWGGRDSFLIRKKMQDILVKNNEYLQPHAEIELANWSDFLELLRLILQEPSRLALCCIPMREISLSYLCTPNIESDKFIAKRLNRSNRIRQFIFKVSSYLVNATGLPTDFDVCLKNRINEILK